MYYHNLNVIRKGSKKLLTIKNSKSFTKKTSTFSIVNVHYMRCTQSNNSLHEAPENLSWLYLYHRIFTLEQGEWPNAVYLFLQVSIMSIPEQRSIHSCYWRVIRDLQGEADLICG